MDSSIPPQITTGTASRSAVRSRIAAECAAPLRAGARGPRPSEAKVIPVRFVMAPLMLLLALLAIPIGLLLA
jgi:hypothetical protein